MPYAILLNELIPLDIQKTARILAKAEHIVYADATRKVSTCRGILAEGLPFHEAESICDELNREGVGVFHMDEDEMYRPDPPRSVNNADCFEEYLNVQDLYGGIHPLFWINVILLSLGLIEDEHLVLDVFSKHPQKMHYRIQHDKFNYDYLGERLTQSSFDNFRLFVEDVVGFAKQAYGNAGINAYLKGEEARKVSYDSLASFDMENLWLLQLIRLEGGRGEEGTPE
jgi:hypothetical protein